MSRVVNATPTVVSDFLAVTKFREYQHYKNRRPPWVKYHTKLLAPNHPINALPIPTRFLFDRMLLLAAEYDNAIPNDCELIANMLRMPRRTVREGIDQLLKGRWLTQTKTDRRASKRASKSASESLPPEAEAEKDLPLAGSSAPSYANGAAPESSVRGQILGSLGYDERQFEVDALMQNLSGTDEHSRQVLMALVRQLPVGAVADVRARSAGHTIKWAVGALKGKLEDRVA